MIPKRNVYTSKIAEIQLKLKIWLMKPSTETTSMDNPPMSARIRSERFPSYKCVFKSLTVDLAKDPASAAFCADITPLNGVLEPPDDCMKELIVMDLDTE
jgi:hypothetical protein